MCVESEGAIVFVQHILFFDEIENPADIALQSRILDFIYPRNIRNLILHVDPLALLAVSASDERPHHPFFSFFDL